MDAKNGLQKSGARTLPKVPWNIQIEGLNEHNLKKKKKKEKMQKECMQKECKKRECKQKA